MRRRAWLVLVLIVFLFSLSLAFQLEAGESLVELVAESPAEVSSQELKKLAVKEGVIPDPVTDAVVEEWQSRGNSVLLWIVSPPENKVNLIEGLKRIHEANQVEIIGSSGYYIGRINAIIGEGIKAGYSGRVVERGIIELFRSLAILEGRYDDGRLEAEVLKEHLGEEGLEFYQRNYPDAYQKALDRER